MFGRLNQRLKAKTSDGGAYNDLDKETENDTGSVNVTSTSQGNSFMFSGTENDNTGLGYSVEMSAAGAGVVPDGNIPNFKKYPIPLLFFFFCKSRYIYCRPSSKFNRFRLIPSKVVPHYRAFMDGRFYGNDDIINHIPSFKVCLESS